MPCCWMFIVIISALLIVFINNFETRKSNLYDIDVEDRHYTLIYNGSKFWSREKVEAGIEDLYENYHVELEDFDNRLTDNVTQRNLIDRNHFIETLKDIILDDGLEDTRFYLVISAEIKDKRITDVEFIWGNKAYLPQLKKKLIGLEIE